MKNIKEITEIVKLADNVKSKYYTNSHFIVMSNGNNYEFAFKMLDMCSDRNFDIWWLTVIDLNKNIVLYIKPDDNCYNDNHEIFSLFKELNTHYVKNS